jgi:hypothetical protein
MVIIAPGGGGTLAGGGGPSDSTSYTTLVQGDPGAYGFTSTPNTAQIEDLDPTTTNGSTFSTNSSSTTAGGVHTELTSTDWYMIAGIAVVVVLLLLFAVL